MKLTGKNLSRVLACALVTGMVTAGTAGYFPAEFTVNEVYAVEATASDAFLATGTNLVRTKIYNDGSQSWNMKGRTYRQGIILGNGSYEDDAEISFNVEGVKTISFDLGHVDGSDSSSAEFSIFLDGTLEDKFTLTQDEFIKEYTLDVSEASVVRIFRNGDYSQYALADFSVDGVATAFPHTVPVYETAAAFLGSSMDAYRAKAYDGFNSAVSFNMNGRTYYQGMVFGNGSYEDDASATFNVENVNTISFSLGHVDNSNSSEAEFSIYLDNVLEDRFKLTQNDQIRDYSIDVSGAKMLKIFRDGDYSQYAIADVTVDDMAPKTTYSTPVYKTSAAFLTGIYDSYRTSVYDGASQAISFNMNGRTYYQGLVFGDGSYEDDAAASLNVENLSTLTFDLGHVDNTSSNSTEFYFYLDNELEDKFTLSMNEPVRSYTLDVSKAKNLRIYRTGDYSKYALANIKADELVPKNTYSVPEFKTSANFVTSIFDNYRTAVYDGVSTATSFNMNGRTYYQGIIFGDGSYEDNAAGSFSVEKYSKVHFSVGHVDNTDTKSADFIIYLDNEPVEKFTLSGGNPIQEFDIDVSDAAVMRIYRTGDYSKYAVADISVDELVPKNTVKIPEYQTASKLIDAAYDMTRAKVYTEVDKFTTFAMGGKEYNQGITLGNGSYDSGSGFSLNVEKTDELSFTLGCVSASDGMRGTSVLTVYGDGQKIDAFSLSKEMVPEEHTIDVSEYKNLRFYNDASYSVFGLGDFKVKAASATPDVTVPAVTTAKPVTNAPAVTTNAAPATSASAAVTTRPVSATSAPAATTNAAPAVTTNAAPATSASAAVTTRPVSATSAPAVTTKPSESVLKGDLNGDKSVTTSDVRVILKHIVGSEAIAETDLKNADIDGDGNITTADALRLLRYVIGETDSL